jgi:hypothetical protein
MFLLRKVYHKMHKLAKERNVSRKTFEVHYERI